MDIVNMIDYAPKTNLSWAFCEGLKKFNPKKFRLIGVSVDNRAVKPNKNNIATLLLDFIKKLDNCGYNGHGLAFENRATKEVTTILPSWEDDKHTDKLTPVVLHFDGYTFKKLCWIAGYGDIDPIYLSIYQSFVTFAKYKVDDNLIGLPYDDPRIQVFKEGELININRDTIFDMFCYSPNRILKEDFCMKLD